MASPTTRAELIEYGKRQLGHPVLEINVADEQIEDALDDTFTLYQDRHMDGVELMYLKYKVTEDLVDRIKARRDDVATGITTTTASTTITGIGATTHTFEENQNYIQVPDTVIGIERVFKLDNRVISTNMFNINYQLFLNEIYYFSSMELLQYTQIKRYLEDIDFILHPDKQIRFNRRQSRLYLDVDAASMQVGDYLVIRCYRILDPNDFPKIFVFLTWGPLILKENELLEPVVFV